MNKRLSADIFFTPQRDYYCLSRHITPSIPAIWHCHEFYEIEIISGGTAINDVNGVPHILNRGDFIILRPDDYHGVQCQDENGIDLINISVSVDLMNEILVFLEVHNPQQLSWPLTGQIPHEMLSTLFTTAKDFLLPTKQPSQQRSLVKQWMTACLLCSNFSHDDSFDEPIPPWMKQLMEKMKTTEGLAGGIEYLKAHTDYSYPHICRCFQKYIFQTPIEWINEQRLIQSAHMLLYTDMRILDISLECGFHNLSHFNHLFKKYYGVAPKTFRTLHQMP